MKVLWVPIFSMRSYDTGKYSILKDGNFQLTMARVLASNFTDITLVVPDDSSDFEEASAKFSSSKVTLVKMRYGKNAVETRETFWDTNREYIEHLDYDCGLKFELLVTDITGFKGRIPTIYNFNITKLPELNRPYIDKFFETDLECIERSLFTTVINPRQREYILEVRPDLLDKVIVHTKCAHKEFLPVFMKPKKAEKLVFWPFRISDKAYQWEQFLEAFEEQGLHEDGFVIFCTDPNDTLECEKSFVLKSKLLKHEYYQMLSARPFIVMLDDIDTVLHPGTIEFFHYKCQVITYKSELIENPNSIDDLSQLSSALHYPVYNVMSSEMKRFIYDHDEIDQYYNKEFVDVRKN